MVRDTLWGYKGNLRDVLRLVGESVELIIPADDINPELLFTATLRYRGIAGDVAPALR
jgi:hypothetical protein